MTNAWAESLKRLAQAKHIHIKMLKILQEQGLPEDVAKKILFINREYRREQMRIPFKPVLREIEHTAVRTKISSLHNERLPDNFMLQEFLSHRLPYYRMRPDGIRVEDMSPHDRRALVNTIFRAFPLCTAENVFCTRKRGMLLLKLQTALLGTDSDSSSEWNSDSDSDST